MYHGALLQVGPNLGQGLSPASRTGLFVDLIFGEVIKNGVMLGMRQL